MNNVAAAIKEVRRQKASDRADRFIRTVDDARRIYVQSSTRLDLGLLAKGFRTSPDEAEVSGHLTAETAHR